jgi:hypothetical protein
MPKTESKTNEAFDRFRRAAQCVVSVPKAEVDRRAAAERKKREAVRRAKA